MRGKRSIGFKVYRQENCMKFRVDEIIFVVDVLVVVGIVRFLLLNKVLEGLRATKRERRKGEIGRES